MANKKCMVYETLNSVQNLQIVESANNEVRLSGVFGVCGVKNNNNRIYSKDNYGKMVEAMQNVIASEGCPGELEHPNTMNITLENVSHKIESIEMNEDGTITGTVLLLNTPKGQIAKAIVEGGLPLYISSRGAGSIDESGHVTLSTIKTYDLVGTPGFSQAKLTLKPNQTLECLNESLEDGNDTGAVWAIVDDEIDEAVKEETKQIVEGDHLLDDDSEDDDKKDDSSDDKKDDSSEDNSDNKKDDEDDEDDDEDKKDNKDIKKDPSMKEIKDAIDALSEKVTNLEAELHIAQESLAAKDETIKQLNESLESLEVPAAVNYGAIEAWVKEEFAPDFKDEILESVEESINEAVESATENIAEGVQNWVCEEFAPEVQNWVTEEFAPEVQNWITEEFAPVVECWITEEFAPEHKENIVNEVNTNVSEFLESQKSTKLDEIDSLLEAIDNKEDNALEVLKESYKVNDKFKGIYCVENMPAEYRPTWETLNEAKQNEIVRSSRMYDFTKAGVLESFWANADMTDTPIVESKETNNDITLGYHNNIMEQMMKLRKTF